MLPPTLHPGENPVEHAPQPETQPSRTARAGRTDTANRERPWLLFWQSIRGAQAEGKALWPLLGGILLLVGVIAFFRFLAASQVAGGCCGGGLVILAGVIFLLIGIRDPGDFSR